MSMYSVAAGCLGALAVLSTGSTAWGCDQPKISTASTVEQLKAFFQKQPKKVVTFLGYSAAGYEDTAAMKARAAAVLDALDPKQTIVNIGATADGIGAVYEMAKQRGFETTGIVSTQARDTKATLATCVDTVFFVEDALWGGLIAGTSRLSPTSSAMVEVSDELIAIGGGEVARDELQAAIRSGKKTQVFPADMNHAVARDRAAKRGQPPPTDFGGAVGAMTGAAGSRRPPGA